MIRIQESEIRLQNNQTGKLAIFLYHGEEDPVRVLDEAVSIYVSNRGGHIQCVDINMDNPWMRIVMTGINDMEQRIFNPEVDRL